MTFHALIMLGIASTVPASAFKLLLASYGPGTGQAGAVQILAHNEYSASLNVVQTSQQCGALPTWLDMSMGTNRITCTDESEPGSLNMLSIQPNGTIARLSSAPTLNGPVSSIYFNNNSAVAVAHYQTPAITTYKLDNKGRYSLLQNITINAPPGPGQTVSRIHQSVRDPTGKFLVFPNLGADRVHVYRINPSNNTITELDPIITKAGYGPRHATFWTSPESGCTFMFVVNELSSRVVSYKATYEVCGKLSFTEVDDVSTFGSQTPLAKAAAGEIAVSPDNRFIIASNRNAPIKIPNLDAGNSTQVDSDTLVTFKPNASGKLEFVELAPSGGISPRHFSLNEDGTKIAVANFMTRNVVVYSRDEETGKMGKAIVSGSNLGTGSLTNVQWLAC